MPRTCDYIFLCICLKVVGETNDIMVFHNEPSHPMAYDTSSLTVGRYVEDIMENYELEKKDLKKIPLNVSVTHYPPFLDLVSKTNGFKLGGIYGSGQAWELLRSLSEFFNFQPIIKRSIDQSIGYQDATGTWRGAIRFLEEKTADLSLMPITLSKSRHQVIDFSIPMGRSSYGMLIKRPAYSSKPDALLKPFNYEVWIWILISMGAMGPLIYGISKFRVVLCDGDPSLTRLFSLDQCIWFVWGAMMKQGSTLEPISDSARILFASWWMFIVIVTAFYTANLTAFLTFNGLELPIKNVEDLAERSDLTWIGVEDSALADYIEVHPALEVLRNMQTEGRGYYTDNRTEALQLVKTGTHIYIDDMRVLEYMIYNDFVTRRKMLAYNVSSEYLCDFYTTEIKNTKISETEVPSGFWWGFGFPKNSSYRRDFNVFFKRLNSYGIVGFLHQNFSGNSVCELPKGFKDRPLQNRDLLTTYYLTLIGIGFSILAFGSELIIGRKRRKSKATWPSIMMPVNFIVPEIKSQGFYSNYDQTTGKVPYSYNFPSTYYNKKSTFQSSGYSPVVSGYVNGVLVLWNRNDNTLVTRDRAILEKSAIRILGDPHVEIEYDLKGKKYIDKLNLNECKY